MNTLVIGKKGQLGAELIKQAHTFEKEVIGLGHDELDVTDRSAVRAMLDHYQPKTVVNTSAYHVVTECEAYPDQALLVNAIALGRLAELCHERGIRLVSYSTDYVFNGKKRSPYKESDRPNPLQWYGISKLAGEYAMHNAAPDESVIIRTNGVYGGSEGSRSKGGNFVLSILRDAKHVSTLEVSGRERVNPTAAKDLARATWQLLEHDVHGIYHLASEDSCSWAEFAQAIVSISGLPTIIQPVHRTEQLRRPEYSVLGNTRAKELGVVLPQWKDAVSAYILTKYETT